MVPRTLEQRGSKPPFFYFQLSLTAVYSRNKLTQLGTVTRGIFQTARLYLSLGQPRFYAYLTNGAENFLIAPIWLDLKGCRTP